MKDKQSRAEIIAGQIKIDAILGAMGKEIATMSCIMGAKSQSGMPPKIVERFKKTSNNPALLDTVRFPAQRQRMHSRSESLRLILQ